MAPGSQQRGADASAAIKAGKDASGIACPQCAATGMRTERDDAEENRFWSVVFFGGGLATLVIVVVAGDAHLVVADLSTIALLLMLAGALLHAVARWRRRPLAYECGVCGYRQS